MMLIRDENKIKGDGHFLLNVSVTFFSIGSLFVVFIIIVGLSHAFLSTAHAQEAFHVSIVVDRDEHFVKPFNNKFTVTRQQLDDVNEKLELLKRQ